MKKNKPQTLTRYSKKLKNVRLARTITVVATLFVSGVVVAANVLPQVIKSEAAVGGGHANDVVTNGVDQWNPTNAKSELIQRVFKNNDSMAQSAKALYQDFGITESQIQSASYSWLLGSAASSPGNVPTKSVAPYLSWHSFGRYQDGPYTPYRVTTASGSIATFYYKSFQTALNDPNTGVTKSRVPVLEGSNGTTRWLIDLACGNIITEKLPQPSVTFTKSAVSVVRAGKTITGITPSSFTLQLNDIITYRISGKNTGNATYPAGLRLADGIPAGTSLVSQGGDGWAGGVTLTPVSPKPIVDGVTYVAWDFSAIPAGRSGYTDMKVRVTSVNSQICNYAIWADKGGAALKGATNKICMPTKATSPLLDITKQAQDAPNAMNIGDKVTYKIVMKNSGTAAASNAVALDILNKDASGSSKSEEFVSLGTPALTKTADGTAIPVASSGYHAVKDAATQKTYAGGNANAYGYQLASMPAGSTLTFTITTKAIKLPEACDFAIANYTGSSNPVAVDKTPNVCIPVVEENQPRVVVTKQAVSPRANTNVARGQTISYNVVVENPSKVAQTSAVTIVDTFTPPGYAKDIKETSRSSSFSLNMKTTVQTDGLTWVIQSIPAGGKITIGVSATVADNAADKTKICNNATLTTNIPNNVPADYSSNVCHNVSLIKQSKTAKYTNRTDDPTKKAANAGDEIQYTLTTTNQATVAAPGYVVTEDLTDVLAYADVSDANGGTLKGNTLTWPAKDIPAGGTITNTFKVKVKNPIPNNKSSVNDVAQYDYNMFNTYGNDVNIKINKPIIQQIVDIANNLPDTGAAQYGLVVFFIGLSVYFFVRNKQLTHELAAATVEYQHQESAGAVEIAQSMVHPEENIMNDDVSGDDSTPPEPPVGTPPTIHPTE